MKASKVFICLMGPTASGKSRLSLELAQRLPIEIVSVDSAMVYRGMDIGTAKPTLAEQQAIKHHLIDICDPAKTYSAGQFQSDAKALIQEIKIPLLVGGTMLYFRALLQGLAPLPPRDEGIRQRIDREAHEKGWPALYAKLKQIDPQAASRINLNDAQRIQRALEVYEITGYPLTHWQREFSFKIPADQILQIALIPFDRNRLHQNIYQRFESMLKQGFIEEVRELKERSDLHPNLPSMRAVGYRQIWDYLEGKASYGEMKEKAIAATRQLAKRQLTWLRTWQNVTIFDSNDSQLLDKVLLMIDKSFFS